MRANPPRLLLICALWLLCWGLGLAPALATQTGAGAAAVNEWQIDSTEDGLYLSANLSLALPELVEDALHKGIAMFFVADARVLRDRWYWSDRLVAETRRYFRLSYQPLTRRWRLNVSALPFHNSGLGVSLGQSFDDYADALATMQRFARWKIAGPGVIAPDSGHTLHFRFRLDLSQLPRPLQIGAVGRSDWDLLLAHSQRLPRAGPAPTTERLAPLQPLQPVEIDAPAQSP